MPDVEPALIHWRGCGVSVLIDCQGDGLPRILYWGADLGPLQDHDLASVALASLPHQGSNQTDARVEVSVLPEQSRGWMGTPGLSGHRDTGAWSSHFVTRSRDLTQPSTAAEPPLANRLRVTAEDPALGLDCLWELEMTQSGPVSYTHLRAHETVLDLVCRLL